VVHPLAPGVERVIDRAVTAPVVSVVPTAEAHFPTARSEAAADWRWVKVVVEVRVTTTLEVLLVEGLVSLTVTEDPLTAVTNPDAAPNCPENRPRAPVAPAGRWPPLPPPGNAPPPGGRPVPPRPPKPPKPPVPPVQVPEVGEEMLTVVAVTGRPNVDLVDDEEEVGLPKAETQDPTVTAAAVVVTV
jgi:hypothetical protein